MSFKRANSSLCESCRPLFYLPQDDPRGSNVLDGRAEGSKKLLVAWHPNMDSLRHSAESSCALCVDAWHQVSMADMPEFRQIRISSKPLLCEISVGNQTFHASEPVGSPLWTIDFKIVVGPEKRSLRLCRHFLIPPIQKTLYGAACPSGSSSHPDISTRSSGLELAKDWLTTCHQKHSACARRRLRSKTLPTRLIEVYQDRKTRKARLVDGNDVPTDSQYLTLSHRWGTGHMITLQTANIAQFRHSIHVSLLSQTFQDAFETTQYLGHTYIWIDSLCIIQDSTSDWEREVHKMAEVYDGATCNLAATASASSGAGLFCPELSDPAKLSTVAAHIWLQKYSLVETCQLVPENAWRSRVEQSALNKRAWVLQERFLSPVFYISPLIDCCGNARSFELVRFGQQASVH
jgi:hypothetical protein